MQFDYRAARDRVMGILRDPDGKPVAYVPVLATIRERMLLIALVEFAPDIRPALSTLGTMVGLSEREVRRLLQGMERKGLIRRESRPGQANRYHITLPTPVKADTPDSPDTPGDSDRPPRSDLTAHPGQIRPPKQTNKRTKQADNSQAGVPAHVRAFEASLTDPTLKTFGPSSSGKRSSARVAPCSTSGAQAASRSAVGRA